MLGPALSGDVAPGCFAAFTAGTLAGQLVAANGSSLIGLFVMSDLTLSASDVTGCTARVGANATAAGTGYFAQSSNQGRATLYTATSTGKSLVATLSAAVKHTMTAAIVPTIPHTGILYATGTNTNSFTEIPSGASSLTTDGGMAHLVDGVSTGTITSGFHIISSYLASATGMQFRVGGVASLTRDWAESIMVVAAFSSVLTTDVEATNRGFIRAYCGY